MTDPIDIDAVRRDLAHSLFGGNLQYHATLPSTNSLARALAAEGAPEGTVIVADEQTAGRGRMGRTWLSPGGGGLLFSVLLRPAILPEQAFALTMILAVSAAEAVERETGLLPRIKWPNDLYLNGGKLAGILTELGMMEKSLGYCVLGMGLNVLAHPAVDSGLRGPATSLRRETGKGVSRSRLLANILETFESGYRRFLGGEKEAICRRWNELSLVLGAEVIVEAEPETIRGRPLRIDPQGALILEVGGGGERRIVCGDVSLRLRPEVGGRGSEDSGQQGRLPLRRPV